MFDDTPLTMVVDDAGMQALAARLAKAKTIGVDTESDSMYHYQERVCLVQFTDGEGDAIVDPLAVSDLSPLKPIFEDPSIVKVFHGADYDIVCLKRDFDFQTRNLFDTLIAAQFLGFERLGLADLIDRFFGEPIDKQYQRHDWSKRPLREEHLDYARGDTHYILALREILDRRLLKVDRRWHHTEECTLLEQKEWQGRVFDPDGWQRIKKSGGLDDKTKRILRQLYLYRDEQARDLDRPPFKVIGDSLLLQIAHNPPETRDSLDRLFPRKRAMKRRHAPGILRAVRAGLEDTSPLSANDRPTKRQAPERTVRARLHGRAAERVQEALKSWRNKLVSRSDEYTPFSVASNSDLRAIARVRPLSLEELGAVPGVRRWQVHEHGEAILAVLDKVAPEDSLDAASGGKRRRRR